MSSIEWADGSAESGPQVRVSRLFPATVGRFDDRADRAVIDGLPMGRGSLSRGPGQAAVQACLCPHLCPAR